MTDFWAKLKTPFYVLAPMAGITDQAFRQRCKAYGADVVVSEMVSATALFYNDEKSRALMAFNESERPFVVQLFGNNPEHFTAAARYIAKHVKPDGIDINFGCPVPKVVKQGAGIALFRDYKRSREVIQAVLDSTDLPISIKTRTRYKEAELLKFLDKIPDLSVAALMVHGRSATAGYSGPVDTETIRRSRDHFGGVVIGNGGVGMMEAPSRDVAMLRLYASKPKAYADWLLEATGADGIGIAQGALGRPWVFKAVRTGQALSRSPRAVFQEALKHARLAVELKGEGAMVEMRKHLAWYVAGLPGAAGLRNKLVRVEKLEDVKRIFTEYSV